MNVHEFDTTSTKLAVSCAMHGWNFIMFCLVLKAFRLQAELELWFYLAQILTATLHFFFHHWAILTKSGSSFPPAVFFPSMSAPIISERLSCSSSSDD
jgi:hypothetical protein